MAGFKGAALDRRPQADDKLEQQLQALKAQLQMAEKAVSEASALLEGLDRRQSAPTGSIGSDAIGQASESQPSAPGHRLIPATDWPRYHPWPSVKGLRHLILHAERNGFHKVIRRAGRRVLILEHAFFAWVEEHPVGTEKVTAATPQRRARTRGVRR